MYTQLKNIVILDPQWLVDSFKTIVSAKQFRDHRHQKEWDILHKDGIVDKMFIYNIWKEMEKERFFELREDLILLMNTMDLISSPRQYNEDGQHILSPYFVVPCMLQTAPADFLKNYRRIANQTNHPLMFQFEYNFLPSATMYRLLSTCIMQYGDSEESKAIVFCDAAVFRVYKQHYLTLETTDCTIIANVITSGNHKPDVGVCQAIREFLEDTLKCTTAAQRTTTKYSMLVACGKTETNVITWLKWNDLVGKSTIVCKHQESNLTHIVTTGEILQEWMVMTVNKHIIDTMFFVNKEVYIKESVIRIILISCTSINLQIII